MEVGSAVWIRDSAESWVAATITTKNSNGNGVKITVTLCHDVAETREISFSGDSAHSLNDEHDGIKLRNDPNEAEVEDLIHLPHLHEPAILHCLQERYQRGGIYTYTGPILIAVNPFKSVPLYTAQILESYYNFGLLKAQGIENDGATAPLDPHVYAIADSAYRSMMIHASHTSGARVSSAPASSSSSSSTDQTVLISGESGAGKTETTKIVLRYLTTVGNGSSRRGLELASGSVMDKVLQSNPILEAFGNARTIRNDNSSRFGKFIELHFNKRGHLIGGVIRTYLLEQVRLVKQQARERTFHVFYQMLAGCTEGEKSKWLIDGSEPRDFHYCNQGNMFQLTSVDDGEEYRSLRRALDTLDFERGDQETILSAVAGLMHFSEVKFSASTDGGDEGSIVSEDAKVKSHLKAFATLCGLSEEVLERVLTVRVMVARDDTYEIKLTPVQAVDARDALAKALYSRLFLYIVSKINKSILVEDASTIRSSINCLDIFGFECFQTNSFEQLCINYCNEQLQQQFNQFIFKMEQAEYEREKIEWSFIEFPDNQDCLDLIEHKQNGILAMLDDECKLPKATDEKFASRLYKTLEKHTRFTANKVEKRDMMFCVRHYAGPVVYSAQSFIEKNKDELPKEAMSLLASSTIPLLANIFATDWKSNNATDLESNEKTSQRPSPNGSKMVSISVGAQFKEQLALLMKKIYATTPHYIRCLKPNDDNVPDRFHRLRVTEQLRYGGVLEAVRVARSGFPVRLFHVEFYSRYRMLANPFSKGAAELPLSISGMKTHKVGKREEPDEEATQRFRVDMCRELMKTLQDLGLGLGDDKSGKKEATAVVRRLRISVISWLGLESHPGAGAGAVTGDGETIGVCVDETSLSSIAISPESIQLGLTKVFLRKSAHDILEGRRTRRLTSCALQLQSMYRCSLQRRQYLRLLGAVRLGQRVIRGFCARQRVRHIGEQRGALVIQRNWRKVVARLRYAHLRRAVIALQCRLRGRIGRRRYHLLCIERNTIRLQRLVRGLVRRRKYRKVRSAVIALQTCLRCRRAKAILKKLRVEAKEVGNLQLNNEALKKEITELRERAAEDAKRLQAELEAKAAKEASDQLAMLREELKAAREELDGEKEKNKHLVSELETAKSERNAAQQQVIELEATVAISAAANGQGHKTDITHHHPVRQHSEINKAHKPTEVQDAAELQEEVQHLRALAQELTRQLEIAQQSSSPSDKAEGTTMSVLHPEEGDAVHVGDTAASAGAESGAGTGADASVSISPRTMATFEKNLAQLRSRLREGIHVQLWEDTPGAYTQGLDCVLQLDRMYELLVFTPSNVNSRRAFGLFAQKPTEIAPLRISNIVDCLPGAASIHDHFFTSLFGGLAGSGGAQASTSAADMLSIVAKVNGKGSAHGTGSSSPGAQKGTKKQDATGQHRREDDPPRVISLKVAHKDDRNFLLTALRTMISDMHVNTPTMRMLRRTTGEQPKAASAPKAAAESAASTGDDELRHLETSADVKKQLLLERSNYERLMLQLFALTNDLNEREETISTLKKRITALEQTLAANEKMREQDAMVRLQLGKRLEQVLMDKEEALEELDLVQTKLESIRSAMALVDFSKAAAIASGALSVQKSPLR